MAVRFAVRVGAMKASEIRELLKLAGQRDVISFGGGLPPNECFPLESLREACSRVLCERGPQSLQYSATEASRCDRRSPNGRRERSASRSYPRPC